MLLALWLPCLADPAIHYAPAENLEHIDVELIDTAKREIDFAAYVLTDWLSRVIGGQAIDGAWSFWGPTPTKRRAGC